jgi:hypothetical protein
MLMMYIGSDRARAREEAALAHMEDREKQYMQKWQEADARAEAAEHALTKMGHEKASLEEVCHTQLFSNFQLNSILNSSTFSTGHSTSGGTSRRIGDENSGDAD